VEKEGIFTTAALRAVIPLLMGRDCRKGAHGTVAFFGIRL